MMYSKKAFQVLCLFAISSVVLTASVSKKSSEPAADNSWNVVQKVYDDCSEKNDFVGCLKGKALTALSRALDQDSVQVYDGLTFVKKEKLDEEDKKPLLSDARALGDLSETDRAVIHKLDKFLRTHTVKLDMSEARGKGKKHYRYVIAALLTAMGIAGPLGLKALAAIAGKALVISKVALTIAGIIALKKIFSSDHHEETSFQVHAGDHNRRNAYLRYKNAANTVDPYRYYYDQQMNSNL